MLIELLQPLGDDSPVLSFLKSHGSSMIHHLAFEVDDLDEVALDVRSRGGVVISRTKDGWGGMEVIFALFFTSGKNEKQIVEYIKKG